MNISEQLQECIETGKGMAANIETFSFTIHPRSIPDTVPPAPKPIPLLREFKKSGGGQWDWNILRKCYDKEYTQYRQAVVSYQIEQVTVARLQRIKAMIERLI